MTIHSGYLVVATPALLAFLAGCSSRALFARALIKEYRLTDAEIKQLQFYVSDGILLEQEATSVDKDIDRTHSLIEMEDRYIRRICFRSGTPCVATSVTADALEPAFEPGESLKFSYTTQRQDGEACVFAPDKRATPEGYGNRPNGAGYYNRRPVGTGRYGDSVFTMLLRRDFPAVPVDEAGPRNLRIDSRVVPGMRQGVQ